MGHARQNLLIVPLLVATVPCSSQSQVAAREIDNQSGLADRIQPDTGTIAAGRFQLRYRIEGTGIPAMVIGSSLYSQRTFSAELRNHFRMAFLDHRGFAPNPGLVDTTAFALDTLLADMEQARQQLRLGRVAVIGHSGHGFMALAYAKRYPQHVSHVIMIGIGPDLSATSLEAAERHWNESASPERKRVLEENLRRIPDEELGQLLLAAPTSERFIRDYVTIGPRIWYEPRFDASPLMQGVEYNMDMFRYVWGEIFRDLDISQGLDTFDRPVFLALGRYDFLLPPPAAWDPIRPLFRNLTVRVFEYSGHTPQYEEADLFNAELMRWIGQHR